MKNVSQGSIVKIPLIGDLGFVYAKYVDLLKLDSAVSYPDCLYVYDYLDKKGDCDYLQSALKKYLIAPILVAGLKRPLNNGHWKVVDRFQLLDNEMIVPDFKECSSTDEEIGLDEYFIFKQGSLSKKERSNKDSTSELQHFIAQGTGNIEIKLTMYFSLKNGSPVTDIFDLSDFHTKRLYKQVLDATLI